MEVTRLKEIMDMGIKVGKNSDYMKSQNNRIILVNLLRYNLYNELTKKLMQICIEANEEIPEELLALHIDKDKFLECVNAFIIGITNGAINK